MKLSFQHVALIGKYQSPVSEAMAENVRKDLESIAQFLVDQGCSVALEAQTALHTGLTQYAALDAAGIGERCDLGLVVGGDGTMLSIGRQLARHGTPLRTVRYFWTFRHSTVHCAHPNTP